MKNIYLALILGLFLISLVSAECSLPPAKQGDTIQLTGTCSNCTYSNLTKIVYPNQSIALLGQFAMTKNGSNFNYTFNPNTIGTWLYSYEGDLNGILTTQTCSVEVTSSGQTGTSNIVFFIFMIVALYVITAYGFAQGNEWIAGLGGMAMLFLGVYLINNGIIIYRDDLTIYFGYITIGLGVIASLGAIIKVIEDNM